jgi:hypothetical protein
MALIEDEGAGIITDEDDEDILDEGGLAGGDAKSRTWGHDTDVEEEATHNLIDGSGTGSVLETGDAERLELDEGEEWILPTANVGAGNKAIELNKYPPGSGEGTPDIQYKTGDTQETCDEDTWHDYGTFFDSGGWAKIKLNRAA